MTWWVWVAGYATGLVLALRLIYWYNMRTKGGMDVAAVRFLALIWPIALVCLVLWGVCTGTWRLATAGLTKPVEKDEVPGRLYGRAMTQAKLNGHTIRRDRDGIFTCTVCKKVVVVNEAANKIWGNALEENCGQVRPAVEL